MIQSLFPAEVVVVRDDPSMEDEALLPEEAAATGRMAAKRLREYTLGRACARMALARLGFESFALVNDGDRVPRWPHGVVGSITHCAGLCAAAVAREARFTGLGLDAEPLRTLDSNLMERICSEAERAHLSSLPDAGHPGGWGLVAFSAKESFYKCYYPQARTFLGFLDVAIEIEPRSGSFEVRLLRDDVPAAAGARTLRGRLTTDGAYVFTAVAQSAGC